MGQDPLPSGNLYAYVGNNPVNFTDRLGTCPGGCESGFRVPHDDCNKGEALVGALISVTGAVLILTPAVFALFNPGTLAASLILIEIVAVPVEIAAFLIILDSECIDLGD